jgi:hypothetical protein
MIVPSEKSTRILAELKAFMAEHVIASRGRAPRSFAHC